MEHFVRRRDLPFVLSFLLPGLLLVGVLTVLPVILVVQYSFYEAKGFTSGATFVGWENYVGTIHDGTLWTALGKTTLYAGGSVGLQMVVGIVIALILNEKFTGNQLVRGAAVVPYILPVVVVTIGWQWILDSDTGIFNDLLEFIGVGRIDFMSADWAMLTSIVLSAWTWTPFVVLVFLSGLQTIPQELYESATLDGAGPLRKLWSITLPMLRGLIVTILLLRGIWMFNKFDLIYLLTGGGPLGATETLPVNIYQTIFKDFDVGRGAALAVVTFVIMIIVMAIYLRLLGDRDASSRPRGRRQSKLDVKS